MRGGPLRPAAWRPRLRGLGLVLLVWAALAGADGGGPEPTQAQLPAAGPVVVERFAKPGPLAGVLARIDLRDPRIRVKLVMADGGGAAGGGAPVECPGQLDVPSATARKHDLAVAVNASFFKAAPRRVGERQVPYAIGTCGSPVGWHFSEGQLRARPAEAAFKATLVVHASGRVSLHASLDQLPADVAYAVSGNAMVLEGGRTVARSSSAIRHPRTAVGVSRDGASLLLVVVDGRQDGHSRGASLTELGDLMKDLGAHGAINLDGGGSTVMVIKDRATGVFAVANSPSELAAEVPGVHLERPVVDVLGVLLREPLPAPATRPVGTEPPESVRAPGLGFPAAAGILEP